jgi:sporulation protein YlmC with PRC-barrel domain
MDLGTPISYQVLEKGTPVYSSDGKEIGKVGHVLADEGEDVFDGVVVSEHLGRDGHRFADADEIAEIHEHGVVLRLDRAACENLPEPSANPAVLRDDPAESQAEFKHAKLRRAWDLISGNY